MSLDEIQKNLEKNLCIPGAKLHRQWLDDECLALWLMDIQDAQAKLSTAEIGNLWRHLPYWAFAWAGGRGLVRFIEANHHLVEDKVVLDFGSGSGIAAIAAVMAGAKKVYASDIDPLALDAIRLNAALNAVVIEVIPAGDWPEVDLLIASDVLYDISSQQDLAELAGQVPQWIIAESAAVAPDYPDIRCLDRYAVSTLPAIGDFDQSVNVDIYARMQPQDLPLLC